MGDEEIMQTLEKFKEFLHVGNLFSDPFRWVGWVFVKGIAYILDGLEKVTDDVLLIKKFFQNAEVVAFVQTIRPFLYILLAFSLLYVGYLLVFQKKFDREGIAINLFIALIVLALLGTGMDKANEFTDEAITAIGSSQLYEEEEGSLSENILSRNIHDLVEFDVNGWSSTDLDRPNTIPLDMISGIGITEKFDSSRSELKMSSAGKDLSKKELIWVATQKDLTKFDQSGVEWNNSYYYRYSLNWVTLLTTMIVMAFTLFSIAYKLARLSFELAFNYILAIIIAPADVHDGQKTKKIIQSILNTFLVIILIFLSMKVYMIGTAYLADQLSGLAYLIALIAFSVAVIDGPNIVERLFGIDAGLKNGWGVLAGAYAGGRMVAGLGKGISNMGKGNSDNKNKSLSTMSGGANGNKPPSPNDPPNDNGGAGEDGKCKKCGQKPCVCNGGASANNNNGTGGDNSTSPNDKDGTGAPNDTDGTGTNVNSSVSQQAESEGSKQRKQTKAPSPNDVEGISTTTGMGGASQSPSNAQTTSSSQSTETANVSDNATVRTDANVTGIQDSVQGNTTGSQTRTGRSGGSQAPTSTQPSGASNAQTTSSSQSTETANVTDNATVRTDANVTGIQDSVQGNTTGSQTRTGGSGGSQAPTSTQPSGASNAQTTSSSQSTETAKVNNNATVRTDTDVSNTVQEVAGSTSTSTSRTGGGTTQAPTERVNTGGTNTAKTTSGSHTTETSKVTSNSTVTTDTEVSNVIQESAATTTTRTDRNSSGNQNSRINQSNERKRPRNYPVDKGSSSLIDRMKNYKNK